MRNFVVRFSIFFFVAVGCIAATAPGFKVAKRYRVSGDSGFDYIVLDQTTNRLYVSHGTEVDVVDADSGQTLGVVRNTPGVHGVAVVPKLHRGFTTNGGNGTVSVFDTDSFETVKNIPVPEDPDFVFYDPTSDRVLVSHGDAHAITTIDPEKETVVGKINLAGPAEASVIDASGEVFVNLEEQAEVVGYDPRSLTIKHTWPITGCKTPTGLAIDRVASRLFIGCRSRVLAVMDAATGKVVATLAIGDRVDTVAFDPDNQLIFASNGDGTISVIRQKTPAEYEPVGDIPTQKSAKTMAFDSKTKRLYLSAAEMEAPVAAGNGQKFRSKPKPGSFAVLVVERE